MTACEDPVYAGDALREAGPVVWVSAAELCAEWRPGSAGPSWTWDDETADLDARVCCCCDRPGHYQAALEAHLLDVGMPAVAVCLGNDGRVWDGHHRIVAARRHGLLIPVDPDEWLVVSASGVGQK